MRWMPFAIVMLLAGCAGPAAEEPPQEAPADDDPGRTGRGGTIDDDGDEGDEDDPDLQPVELLRTPLTFAGQGPESFDLTVPPGLVMVGFEFTGATFEQSGMRLELTGCGTYDTGVGFTGSTGSAQYSDRLCEAPTPGPATVTISATLMVFEGTFVLTGFTPAAASGPGGNATAGP